MNTYLLLFTVDKSLSHSQGQDLTQGILVDSGIKWNNFKWNHGTSKTGYSAHVWRVICTEDELLVLKIKGAEEI